MTLLTPRRPKAKVARWPLIAAFAATLGFSALAAPGAAQPAEGAVSQAPDSLDRAYKKEFAYLEAHKRALTQRLQALRTEDARRSRDAQAEIDRLQGRLLSMSVQAERLEQSLVEAERQATATSDREDALTATLEQARATLKGYGLELAPAPLDQDTLGPAARAAGQSEQLTSAFTLGLSALTRGQRVERRSGEFFLADGTSAQGTIVRVGAVAAFGVHEREAGALAPAGDGRLKLWPDSTGEASAQALTQASAQALARGQRPASLRLLLFESLDKNLEPKQARTWVQTVQVGGLVAWVIVALGALGVLLVLARGLIFAASGAGAQRLLAELGPLIDQGQLELALARARGARGAVARVLEAALLALPLERQQAEDMIAEVILREAPKIERFGTILMVFAAVAPLLGLLGTVTGMISTFDIITEFGTGDPKMLSGGISEALITTELGLIVAIPMLLLGNLTNGEAARRVTSLERAALHVLNRHALRALPEDSATSTPRGHAQASSAADDLGPDAPVLEMA